MLNQHFKTFLFGASLILLPVVAQCDVNSQNVHAVLKYVDLQTGHAVHWNLNEKIVIIDDAAFDAQVCAAVELACVEGPLPIASASDVDNLIDSMRSSGWRAERLQLSPDSSQFRIRFEDAGGTDRWTLLFEIEASFPIAIMQESKIHQSERWSIGRVFSRIYVE